MTVHMVMLGHNRAEVVRGAMENLEKTMTDAERPHVSKRLFICGYPLPSQEQNRDELFLLAKEFGWEVAEIENKGVMANHNTVIHEYLTMKNGDFYVTFDPDVRMRSPGWIQAMVDALNSDPDAMFCSSSLYFHHHDWMQQPPYSRRVTTLPNGTKVARWGCLIAWASGMWKSDVLITRPRHFAEGGFYGWSEHADYERLLVMKKTWVSVPDFIDDHLGAPDPEYTEWKQEQANKRTALSFAAWIKQRSNT